MATAIELAQNGIRSTVLEARGEVAGRQTLFNVVPAFADRLAALAPDGSLTGTLVPTSSISAKDLASGRTTTREFTEGLSFDAARGRGDIGAILRAVGNSSAAQADTRRWSKVGIGDLENAMREYAGRVHGGMIDVRYGAKVTGITQDAQGVDALVEGSDQAVRGAMLVDASGRNLLGASRTVYPEQVHWLGGIYPHARALQLPDEGLPVQRVYSPGRTAGPDGIAGTMALHHADRTIVWTEAPGPGAEMDPAAARALIADRAAKVGVTQELPKGASPIPVSTQLWTSTEPARGRVLAVGDSVRAPYFMTSTGAATALVHDTPRAVDAARAVMAGTSSVDAAAGAYADAVRGANEQLVSFVRPALLRDVGIGPRAAAAPVVQPAR